MSDQRVTATEVIESWAELRKEREKFEREWWAQFVAHILPKLDEKPATPAPTRVNQRDE